MSKYKTIEKIAPKFFNHIKVHWWKWALTGTLFGLSFSGYSCEFGKTKIKKSAPFHKQEQVKNEISNTV